MIFFIHEIFKVKPCGLNHSFKGIGSRSTIAKVSRMIMGVRSASQRKFKHILMSLIQTNIISFWGYWKFFIKKIHRKNKKLRGSRS
ncbi:MAG: hypothetical protein C5B59_01350 [Bacteroidetes bacterium]|nr:MAG: hypothetical protein C5B59_01350 [Bacteroidota bacterium]